MKYIRQFLIILLISFLGELLKYIIPLSVPASIYGMVLMFLALELKILKVSDVKETSTFLIEIMPLMFVPAGGGIAADLGTGRHYHVDFYGGCHGCLRNNHAVGDPEGSEENEGGIGRWIRFLQIQFLWAW